MGDNQTRKVLIIDDEEKFTKMVKKNLENEGNFEVVTLNEAEKGFETAKEMRPDIVLLDVLMPGKRGPEIASEIRKDDKIGKTPIIFITATVDKGQTEAFGGLVDGVPFTIKPAISKPVKTKDLVAKIEQELAAAASGETEA